jgi:glycosyltransferase involved in cell wall biosynthesis
MGRPILMAVAGDAGNLVEQARAGFTCPPEDPAAMAAAVRRLRMMATSEREAMGVSGKRFYDKHLSMSVGVNQFECVFAAAVRTLPVNRHRFLERRELSAIPNESQQRRAA